MRARTLRMTTTLLVILGAVHAIEATLPAQTRPAFEVASVRKVEVPERVFPRPMTLPGGVFNPGNITVAGLILYAFDIQDFQMAGGPDWIRDQFFNVNARAGREVPADQVRLMVQSLLADRFGLVMHREARDMRYLALVTARSDGSVGPYLLRRGEDCDAAKSAEARKALPPRERPTSGPMALGACTAMSDFARLLSGVRKTPTVDKTGLSGRWTYEMFYTPDPLTGSPQAGPPDSGLPSLETALTEQLGLELTPERGPIEVLVVDSVQQPTEN